MSEEAAAQQPEEENAPSGGYSEAEGIPFTREDNIFRVRLSSTDFRVELEKRIEEGHFTARAKRTMTSTVKGFYDRVVFYSNQTDLEGAIIDFQIAIILMRLSCTRRDIRQPEFPHILIMMENIFKMILTRTYGPNRERQMQKYFPMVEQRSIQGIEQPEEVPAKKGGFFSFGQR